MGSLSIFHFVWVIFPVLGMGIAYFAIWKRHQRQKQALDLLKVYAEKGQEPPPAMLEVLRGSMNYGRDDRGDRGRNAWPRVILFSVMAVGFAAAAIFVHGDMGDYGAFIPTIIFAAIALSALAGVLTSRGQDDK